MSLVWFSIRNSDRENRNVGYDVSSVFIFYIIDWPIAKFSRHANQIRINLKFDFFFFYFVRNSRYNIFGRLKSFDQVVFLSALEKLQLFIDIILLV